MNVQQAAAIYIRHIFSEKSDALHGLIVRDFWDTHNVELADTDAQPLLDALDTLIADINLHVTGEQIRHATEQLVNNAWEATDVEENE